MRFQRTSIFLLLLLACAVQLVAQESRGTIVGTVTDPSGAVVPGASVQVVNVAMGTKLALSTNEAGVFQASFLIPGAYNITV